MADPAFDTDKFRTLFPQFANVLLYPDASLEAWWTMANCAMQEPPCLCLTDDCGSLMLYLMTAHIAALLTRAATSAAVGNITSASIDKVTVSFSTPPYKTGWQAWLASTPYGTQLWAMLSAFGAGGFSVNGRREASAFRGVAGRFRG